MELLWHCPAAPVAWGNDESTYVVQAHSTIQAAEKISENSRVMACSWRWRFSPIFPHESTLLHSFIKNIPAGYPTVLTHCKHNMGGSISTVMLADFMEDDLLPSSTATFHSTDYPSHYSIILCHSNRLGFFYSQSWATITGNVAQQYRVMTELTPSSLKARSKAFQQAQRVIVLLDYNAINSTIFLESLSFIKLLRKDIHASKLDDYFFPIGGCAAICMAYGHWYPNLTELLTALQISVTLCPSDTHEHHHLPHHHHTIGMGESKDGHDVSEIEESVGEVVQHLPHSHSLHGERDLFSTPSLHDHNILDTTVKCKYDIFFSYSNDEGKYIADYLLSHVYCTQRDGERIRQYSDDNITYTTGEREKDIELIQQSHVVVFIITTTTIDSLSQYSHLESVRRFKRELLPIKREKAPLGESWLALSLAGRLYYEIDPLDFNKLDVAFVNIPDCMIKITDSCMRIEIQRATLTLLSSSSSHTNGRDDSQQDDGTRVYRKMAIDEGISLDEIERVIKESERDNEGRPRRRLSMLLDANQCERDRVGERDGESKKEREADRETAMPTIEEVLPSAQSLPMSDIHYTITRLDPLVLSPSLTEREDVMLSYEWNSQKIALDVYYQLHMKNVTVWLDVMGSMQGNMNTAMAQAVERVSVIVVLLSHR